MTTIKRVVEPCGSRVAFYLGPWKVGVAYYDGLRPKGEGSAWTAACYLPGIKALGHFTSLEAAGQGLEDSICSWFIAIS